MPTGVWWGEPLLDSGTPGPALFRAEHPDLRGAERTERTQEGGSLGPTLALSAPQVFTSLAGL